MRVATVMREPRSALRRGLAETTISVDWITAITRFERALERHFLPSELRSAYGDGRRSYMVFARFALTAVPAG